MKSIKLVLVVLSLLLSNIAFASTNPTEDKLKMTVAAKEIAKLLENPSFLIKRNTSITVKFTVNKKNEIVVLSVEVDNNNFIIEEYIKRRLNYKRLRNNIKAEIYTLPVKIVSL